MDGGSAGFDDDRNLIVVTVAEPVEGHVARAFSSNASGRTMQAASGWSRQRLRAMCGSIDP
jgi:hypothetical protein